jgi:hypothetical protein
MSSEIQKKLKKSEKNGKNADLGDFTGNLSGFWRILSRSGIIANNGNRHHSVYGHIHGSGP